MPGELTVNLNDYLDRYYEVLEIDGETCCVDKDLAAEIRRLRQWSALWKRAAKVHWKLAKIKAPEFERQLDELEAELPYARNRVRELEAALNAVYEAYEDGADDLTLCNMIDTHVRPLVREEEK